MENIIYERWNDILEHMKTEFEISEASFRTFIKILSVDSIDGDNLTILIHDKNIGNSKSHIENRYKVYLQVSIEDITNVHYNIIFISETENNLMSSNRSLSSAENVKRNHPFLNSGYTFDTFIVGDNNDYAQAASLKVAEDPGKVYNPLFIYGGAGLGKTHLMHAIANYILDHDESKKIMYVTSETFVNEIVSAIGHKNDERYNNMNEFRNKYRSVDVLLIDDIQFIIGKETMQQEFFHTFNHLYELQKQIVISSDKHPATMKTLEERLRSRFEQGLTVDIKPPTYETRMAILKKKVEEANLEIDNSILDYVANNIYSNVRELQGAITKVIAFAKLRHKEITMELTKEALADMINPNEKKQITIDYIIDTVADHYNIPVKDILSERRTSEIVLPRQVCMYLCRQILPGCPYTEIATHLRKKDHTTIISGEAKIKKLLENKDVNLLKDVDTLMKKINP